MSEKVKRNEWLDVVKLFAAFMVVFIHVPFSRPVGDYINALGRFAVPLFFAVSGFFALNADIKTLRKRLLKIIVLYATAAFVYLMFIFIFAIKENGIAALEACISNMFSVTSIINYLCFNVPFTYLHLWFLPALIYVYVIWILFCKTRISDRAIFIICVLCLAANLILCEGLSFFGIAIPSKYVRNFAIMGLPFFGFGYFINKYIHKIRDIKTWVLVLIFILGVCETIASRYLLAGFDLYLGSVCICFALLALAIKNSNKKSPTVLNKIAATNTDIYVYHIIIALSLKSVLSAISVSVTSLWFVNLWPIITSILCIGFSLCKNFVLSKIKAKFGKKIKILEYIQ